MALHVDKSFRDREVKSPRGQNEQDRSSHIPAIGEQGGAKKAAVENAGAKKVAAEKVAVGKVAKSGAERPSLEKRVASGEHAEATPAKAAASSFDLAGSASGSERVRQPYEAPPPVKQLGPSIHAPMRVEDLDHDEAPPEGTLAASTKGGAKGKPSTAPTTTQPSRSWTSSSRSWSWWGASGWGR